MNYKILWVGGQDGHWEIYKDGEFIISCDDNELSVTLKTL